MFHKVLYVLHGSPVYFSFNTYRALHSKIPILELYRQIKGFIIPEKQWLCLKKKYPNIEKLSHDQLQCTLQLLNKFNITASEACQNIHLFTMNPITMDNYGEILKECGFINIAPGHIIKYHTIAKSKSITKLKKEGLISANVELEQKLLDIFKDWPTKEKTILGLPEHTTSMLTIRTSILERYLKWRLSITTQDFEKYCRNYLPLRHKPMADIKESLDMAKNSIKLDDQVIRRNGFIIAADPINTKLILENVKCVAGFSIQEAIRIEPAILKNNYKALLKIRDILEAYRIPVESQQKYLKIFCMCPDTVNERLEELQKLKEYHILMTNPRALGMVVHKKKFLNRLNQIQTAKKQSYSLNHLLSSNKIFNNYIASFGSKTSGRDIISLIQVSLQLKENENICLNTVLAQLRRHKFWLHAALSVIHQNIQLLRSENFTADVILKNCQLLLYPFYDVSQYISTLLKLRHSDNFDIQAKCDLLAKVDPVLLSLKHKALTDEQILSLVLYAIEKKYHFSCDGVWMRQDGIKLDM